jgi:MFS family permease
MAGFKNNIRLFLRAFNYRNYRLFFTGQVISVTGSWMQTVALSWLVYRLTNSPLMLGVVPFATMLPAFLVAPFAGVLNDRLDKRRLLISANALAAAQATALAVLSFTGVIQPWHIIALGLVLGFANGFEMTSRHAFIPEIVERKEDLINAISLNSALFNTARLAGPAIAGIILATTGEGVCFIINALSYLAIIAAVTMMRVRPKAARRPHGGALKDLKEGLSYTFTNPPMRSTMLLMAFVSLAVNSCFVLLPVVAREILRGGPKTLGLLMSSMGAGALCGAVFMAMRRGVKYLGYYMSGGVLAMGLSIFCGSFAQGPFLICACVFCAGFGMMLHMASSNTLLQTLSPDEKRGRVMSFYIMSFTGFGMLGNLLAGWLAKITSVRLTFLLFGIDGLLASAVFVFSLQAINAALKAAHVKMTVAARPDEI